MATLQLSRSTKGASKQRRDNINSEVSIIRSLLPLTSAVRNRLSQLQVMSMCKCFLGKSNLLSTMNNDKSELVSQLWDFPQALAGFMMITDSNGNIVYLTENTMEYLTHSMMDIVSQSENILDIVHPDDKSKFGECFKVRSNESESKIFSCRMGLMKHPKRNYSFDKYKVMKVNGKLVSSIDSGQCYFVALCTPQLDCVMATEPAYLYDTFVFKSTHSMDLKLISLDQNGQFHLGYSEVEGMSWYSMIHPQDINNVILRHTELLRTNLCDLSVWYEARVQRSDGSFIWLHVVMMKESSNDKDDKIICWNQVLHPNEVNSQLEHSKMAISVHGNYASVNFQEKNSEKSLKRKFGLELKCQEEKKTSRSELLEKLKKKMKKNEDDVERKTFDESSTFFNCSPKSEPNISNKNAHALSEVQNGLNCFQKYLNFSQAFETPKQTHSLILPTKQEDKIMFQTQQTTNNNVFCPVVSVNQNTFLPTTQQLLPPSFQQPKDHSKLDFLQNSLFSQTSMNNSNDLFDHSFSNSFNNNLVNNNFINSISSLDSKRTTNTAFSYAASSPYSANSPRNSEDFNNQSFFAQMDEIKSEFPSEDYNSKMAEDPCKVKMQSIFTDKASFPELELQDIDDCLKRLERSDSIKIEPDGSFFFTPLTDQMPSQDAFTFSDDLSNLNDEFVYLDDMKNFSFLDYSTPVAGLQASPMMAF